MGRKLVNSKKYEKEIRKIYEEKGITLTDEECENIGDDLINFATLLVDEYFNRNNKIT